MPLPLEMPGDQPLVLGIPPVFSEPVRWVCLLFVVGHTFAFTLRSLQKILAITLEERPFHGHVGRAKLVGPLAARPSVHAVFPQPASPTLDKSSALQLRHRLAQ